MFGIYIGILEIIFFVFTAFLVRKCTYYLRDINIINYYWLTLTVLTGIWETSFIINHKLINNSSKNLLINNTHVWTTNYTFNYTIPWKLSKIFYAEYGSWADREYMTSKDDWSVLIEGTHAIFCGIFAMLALHSKSKNFNKYLLYTGIAMGSQLMNSILYMGEYIIQTQDKHSTNFDSLEFPCGLLLSKRPFMYVNILWTVMPIYVLSHTLSSKIKEP